MAGVPELGRGRRARAARGGGPGGRGVCPGDRVALISDDRFEWILADLGIQAAGAVTVPLYPSLLPATVRDTVEDGGAVVGIGGTEELAGKLRGAATMRLVTTVDRDLQRWFQREPSAGGDVWRRPRRPPPALTRPGRTGAQPSGPTPGGTIGR